MALERVGGIQTRMQVRNRANFQPNACVNDLRCGLRATRNSKMEGHTSISEAGRKSSVFAEICSYRQRCSSSWTAILDRLGDAFACATRLSLDHCGAALF